MSISTIVVGVDGSDGAHRAVAWTADLAAQVGARVVAVHTFEPLAHLEEPPFVFERIEDDVRKRFEHEWTEPLARANVRYETHIKHGMPTQVLIDTANEEDADLVVVGARGLGTLRGLALGSTSSKLVHTCHRPVVVVPPPEQT